MRSNSDQFAAIDINWANAAGPIAGLNLIFALVTLVNGLLLVATLAAFRLNLAASEWLPLTIATQAANYLLPVVNSPDNDTSPTKWQGENREAIERFIPTIVPTMRRLGYTVEPRGQ